VRVHVHVTDPPSAAHRPATFRTNLQDLSSHSLTGGVAAWRVASRVAPARGVARL